MNTGKKKTKRALAKEETRRALLAAGVEELGDSLSSPVENVKSANVADRVGLTTGAFYHHWPTQEEFQTDLRAHITDADFLLETESAVTRSIGSFDPDAVRRLVKHALDEMFRSPLWRVQLAMLAGQVAEDVECAHDEYDLWALRMATVYDAMLEGSGLSLRPGIDTGWLARSISAIVEGFGLQRLANIDEPSDSSEWSSAELAVAALLLGAVQSKDAQRSSIPAVLGDVLDTD